MGENVTEGLHSPLADFGMMQQGDLSCPYSSAYRPLKSMPSIGKILMRQTQSTPSTPHLEVEGQLLPIAPCIQKEHDLVPLSDLDERVLAAEVAYAQNPTIIAEDLNSTRILEGLVGFNSLVADPVLYGGDMAANHEQSQQQPEHPAPPEPIPLMQAEPATSMPPHSEWPIGQSVQQTFMRVKAQCVFSPRDNYQIENISAGHNKITLLGYDERHLNELRLNGELVFTTNMQDAKAADTAAAVSRRKKGRHFEEQA